MFRTDNTEELIKSMISDDESNIDNIPDDNDDIETTEDVIDDDDNNHDLAVGSDNNNTTSLVIKDGNHNPIPDDSVKQGEDDEQTANRAVEKNDEIRSEKNRSNSYRNG